MRHASEIDIDFGGGLFGLPRLPRVAVVELGHKEPPRAPGGTPPERARGSHPSLLRSYLELATAVDVPHDGRLSLVRGLPSTTWDRPRGLRWGDYPIVSDMRVRVRDWSNASVHATGRGDEVSEPIHEVDVVDAIAGAGLIVLSLFGELFATEDAARERRTLASARTVLTSVGVDEGTPVAIVRIGRAPTRTTLAGLGHVAEAELTRSRFAFSYGVNAGVLLGRILADLLDATDDAGLPEPSEPIFTYDRTAPNHAELVRGLSNGEGPDLEEPLTLQGLFRLRRAGEGGMPIRSSMLPELSFGRPFGHMQAILDWSDLPWQLAGAPDRSWPIAWVGSGRWPPHPVGYEWFAPWLKTLLRYRMIETDLDAMRLTRLGEGFLAAVHPDMEDPDLPLRWAEEPDRAAMDSWILRNFRKVRGRIPRREG